MKRLILGALSLLLLSCGTKPEQPAPPAAKKQPLSQPVMTKPTSAPASAPTSLAALATSSAPTSLVTSLPPCPEDDDGACLVERLGEDELGPLKQGLAAKDVLALLKAPEQKDAIIEEGATGLFIQAWKYPALGISLGMAANTKKGEQAINTLSISAPCTYKSKRGLGLGSTLAELKSAYQDAMSKDDLARTDPEGSYIAGSVYGGIAFQLKDGKVTEIFMGAMAE